MRVVLYLCKWVCRMDYHTSVCSGVIQCNMRAALYAFLAALIGELLIKMTGCRIGDYRGRTETGVCKLGICTSLYETDWNSGLWLTKERAFGAGICHCVCRTKAISNKRCYCEPNQAVARKARAAFAVWSLVVRFLLAFGFLLQLTLLLSVCQSSRILISPGLFALLFTLSRERHDKNGRCAQM